MAKHSPRWIESGTVWKDTNGKKIEAHGGGILFHNGLYFWYGEEHSKGFGNKTGIACYSSRDLLKWKFEAIALPKAALPKAYRDAGVCERPKVIFCRATGKFVLWAHLDGEGYVLSEAGVAISDHPAGPFKLVRHFRPIHFDFGYETENVPGGAQKVKIDEKGKGNTFRDMQLFVDEDERAYVIYSSESNATTYISRLNEDYTDIQRPVVFGETWSRNLAFMVREAPVMFKSHGKYYLLTSGCTGWSPNPMMVASAPHPLGPWQPQGDPCRGKDANTSYRSQPTYVLPVAGAPEGGFIYMGDRWDAADIRNATYTWWPFYLPKNGSVLIDPWQKWSLDFFKKPTRPLRAPKVRLVQKGTVQRLCWPTVHGASAYEIYRNGILESLSTETEVKLTLFPAGRVHAYTVVAKTLFGDRSPASRVVVVKTPAAKKIYLDQIEPDHWQQGFGTLGHGRNVMDGPLKIHGKVYQHGLGTHAISEISYGLGGEYKKFTATLGLDDSHQEGTVEFQVFCNGSCVLSSGVMTTHSPARKISISLEKVQELKLVVTDAGDGTHHDHANWADALLHP